MTEQTTNSKQAVIKSMAVVGFVAVLVFGVWLAVQIVQVIPNAFSSLASIADGVYNSRPTSELTVANSKSIVNSGESFVVTWTNLNRTGVYTFTYACAEGVALEVRDQAGRTVGVACDTPLNLGTDATELTVIAAAEKNRFTDVSYTIGFGESVNKAEYSKSSTFTVVNANIPQSADIADATNEENEETEETEVVVEVPTPTPEVTTPAPKPVVTERPIFAIPQSDPNGFVDLAVSFISVGALDENNRYTTRTNIDNDTRGAFQFAVQNLGTKTSSEWTYEARLTSGTIYDSEDQAPLKPNERAVITIGFDAVGDTGIRFFGIEVNGGNDRNDTNNEFVRPVTVIN